MKNVYFLMALDRFHVGLCMTATSYLLRIKRVDSRLHQHVGQDQVLQTSGSSGASRLIIVFERLEKVCMRLLELALPQVHFTTTF